ncbi:Hsp20/alpha crystallin family protein [Pelagicoccus albus]|uniref:Hsp20/alpha crystallin family protein n=1 Tax=Pelagicoccus albus TaxID=415222 RepID=A0A7X1B5J3_9BACT|nr:Hsp20/alpha crystallin family protein [Pelagicoccus albus]MBC2606044.1 Hsp20/alpha crystallin family protein [Pelagicoccus albus]
MSLLNVTKKGQPTAETSEGNQSSHVRYVRPVYQIEEQDSAYQVQVDLPGVVKDQVEITLADGVLEILGSREWVNRKDWNPLAGVSEDGLVYRLRLDVSEEVDGESIAADFEYGVLRLTLSKAEEKKPRRIAID